MEPNKTKLRLDVLDKKREELATSSNKNIWIYILFPIVATLIAAMIFFNPFVIAFGAFSALISALIYYGNYTVPFNKLKVSSRTALLEEFIDIFHPGLKYQYQHRSKYGKRIAKESNLISFNRSSEEDVLYGSKKNVDFYISELKLKKKKDKSTKTVFKGILFKLKLKGRTFPKSRISSSIGLLSSIFGSYKKSEKYGFYFDSQNPQKLFSELEPLFPFIQHLIQNEDDLRISLDGDSITILLGTKMKFLDSPKPRLNRSFHDETYYATMTKQLNTLLYIVESFADELSPLEIEEKLKLRVLEYAEKTRHK